MLTLHRPKHHTLADLLAPRRRRHVPRVAAAAGGVAAGAAGPVAADDDEGAAVSEDVEKIAKMLRGRKVRRNVARMALDEAAREDQTKPGPGSLASSIVMTARLKADPAYRRAVRQANRYDRLVRWGLRKRGPGRPASEVLAEIRATRGQR